MKLHKEAKIPLGGSIILSLLSPQNSTTHFGSHQNPIPKSTTLTSISQQQLSKKLKLFSLHQSFGTLCPIKPHKQKILFFFLLKSLNLNLRRFFLQKTENIIWVFDLINRTVEQQLGIQCIQRQSSRLLSDLRRGL